MSKFRFYEKKLGITFFSRFFNMHGQCNARNWNNTKEKRDF